MTRISNTELPEEQLSIIERIAKEEHLDRESLIKKWISEKTEEYQIKKQAEYYRKGIVSLAEAASNAGVTVYRMMDYIREENIHPPEQTTDEIKEEYEEAIKMIKEMK